MISRKLTRVFVEARDIALVVTGIDDQWIAGIGRNVARFAAAHGIPVLAFDVPF